MDKLYYPQNIEDQPFVGPLIPEKYGSKSPNNIYFPGSIASKDFPRPVVASNVIGMNLNTQSRQILGNFSFGKLGAIAIGNYQSGVSGDIRISPNGIVGRNSSGQTTFAIDGTTGNATFKGIIAAGSIIANTIDIDWAQITNVSIENADIVNLDASKITTGNISASRMQTNVLTALQAMIANLSSISANIGTVTAGAINGVTIRTAASGLRVQLDSNFITFYNAGGTNIGGFEPTSGVILADGDFRFLDDVVFDGFLGDLDVAGISGTGGSIDFSNSGRIQTNNHFDPPDAGSKNLGGSSRYWNDVHCKDVVDHSMGWFDEGFEIEGEKISDVEAIKRVKPHASRKMPNGRPYLDKRTFPKELFRPAEEDGKVYARDKDDRPFLTKEDGSTEYLDAFDAVSLTQTVALIFGAVKELDERITVLETAKKKRS